MDTDSINAIGENKDVGDSVGMGLGRLDSVGKWSCGWPVGSINCMDVAIFDCLFPLFYFEFGISMNRCRSLLGFSYFVLSCVCFSFFSL